MKRTLVLILLSGLCARAEDGSDRIARTKNAGAMLDAGNGICFLSMWGLIPIIYDTGLLMMTGARGTLAREYRGKFHEDPPRFGESGERAYINGWLLKAGAVASLYIGFQIDQPALAILAFPTLWLAGTFKHFEAQRLMYDDGVNRKNLILDPGQSRRPSGKPDLKWALSFPF